MIENLNLFQMPNKYKNNFGRMNRRYQPKFFEEAIQQVKQGKLSIRKASEKYAVPYSTLQEALKVPVVGGKPRRKYGGQPVLSEEEEARLLHIIFTCADWKLPLTRNDICCIVQDYLNQLGKVTPFRDNKPGKDWWKSFKGRHPELSEKLAENMKRARMSVTEDTVREYFRELEESIKDVPPANIVNYDETNFRDDPGAELVCGRRGTRLERTKDTTKSSTSVMFACAGDGELLPPFVVYKALNVYETWKENGLPGAQYAATKSGWFDMGTFELWFMKILLPYMKRRPGPRVIIGDNLGSHLSVNVVEKCLENDIRFVFLPPNATDFLQPLDVSVFRPLKGQWRSVLNAWKDRNFGSIPKAKFPQLLRTAVEQCAVRTTVNIISGFRATGIIPFDPDRPIQKKFGHRNASLRRTLSSSDSSLSSAQSFSSSSGSLSSGDGLDNVVVSYLQTKLGEIQKVGTRQRGKKVQITPGKAVTMEVFTDGENNRAVEELVDSPDAVEFVVPVTPVVPSRKRGRPKKIFSTEAATGDAGCSGTKEERKKACSRDAGSTVAAAEPVAGPSSAPQHEPIPVSLDQLTVGTFVRVKFPLENGMHKNYMGCVVMKGQHKLEVSYLRRRGNIFVYPAILDTFETQLSWIQEVVDVENMGRNRFKVSASIPIETIS